MHLPLLVRTVCIWYGVFSIVAAIGLYRRKQIRDACKSKAMQKVTEFIRPKHISPDRKLFIMVRKFVVITVIWFACAWAEKHRFFETAGKSGELLIGSFVDHWIFPESEVD